MKLVDVMSGAGLSGYAIVARTFAPGAKARHAYDAGLPLQDDDSEPAPRARE